jgi:hypothetical protein
MSKTNPNDPVTPLRHSASRCPICDKPSAASHRPFCSGRCADIDLGRWLKGNYRVETNESPDDPPEDERP